MTAFVTGCICLAVGLVGGWLAHRKFGPAAENIRTAIDKNLGAK